MVEKTGDVRVFDWFWCFLIFLGKWVMAKEIDRREHRGFDHKAFKW